MQVVELFLFKQKMAYEWRISDWSSDVCSSDLPPSRDAQAIRPIRRRSAAPPRSSHNIRRSPAPTSRSSGPSRRARRARRRGGHSPASSDHISAGPLREAQEGVRRSEEHTSELQSLMRISYAVFCLKKKINNILQSYIKRTTQQPTHK